MIIDQKYKIRNIAGESVILKQGKVGTELTKIIALNDSAAFLFESFKNKTFNTTDVAQALVDRYDIDLEIATKDATDWINPLKELQIIIE